MDRLTIDDRWNIREYFNRALAGTWGTPTDFSTTFKWFNIRTDAAINDSKFQMTQNASYGRIITAAGNGLIGAFLDGYAPGSGEVLVKLVVPTSPSILHASGVIIGQRSGIGTFTSVMLHGDGKIRVTQYNGTTWANKVAEERQVVSYTFEPGVYYWVRVKLHSGLLYVKAWEATNIAEPLTPQINGLALNTYGKGANLATHAGVAVLNDAASTAFTSTFAQFYYRSTASSLTESPNITDNMTGYNMRTAGHASSTYQEWVGDFGMNPVSYRGNRSSGAQMVEIERLGDSLAIWNGITELSGWVAGTIGPERSKTTSHQRLIFSFRHEGMQLRLGHLGSSVISGGSYAPRLSAGTKGIEANVIVNGGFVGVITAGATLKNYTIPFTFEINKFYQLRTQIKSNRFYARVWPDGDPEPAEWLFSHALPAALEDTGYNYIQVYFPAATTGYRFNYYGASSTPVVSQWFGEVTRSIKSTMKVSVPKVVRRDEVEQIIRSNFSAYPSRGRLASSTSNMMKGTLAASGYRRINIQPGVAYLPQFKNKMVLSVTPLRRRKSTVTRQVKSTFTHQGKRTRLSSVTMLSEYTFTPKPQVIPEVNVILNSFYGISVGEVITKTGQATLKMKQILSVLSQKRVSGSVVSSLTQNLHVSVPGKIIDTVTLPVESTLVSLPTASFIEETSSSFGINLVAEGFVATLQLGSVVFSHNQSLRVRPVNNRSSSVSVKTTSGITARPVRTTNHNVAFTGTFSLVLDRPDFEIVYEKLIRKRSAFIHFACTRVAGTNITIQYRHRRTMEAESRTYFFATDDNKHPTVFGYSQNLWDDDAILVYVAPSLSDPIIDIVTQEFNLGLAAGALG